MQEYRGSCGTHFAPQGSGQFTDEPEVLGISKAGSAHHHEIGIFQILFFKQLFCAGQERDIPGHFNRAYFYSLFNARIPLCLSRLECIGHNRGIPRDGCVRKCVIRHDLATPGRALGHDLVVIHLNVQALSNQTGIVDSCRPGCQFLAKIGDRKQHKHGGMALNRLSQRFCIDIRPWRRHFFIIQNIDKIGTMGHRQLGSVLKGNGFLQKDGFLIIRQV